jgi:hypothetical protein
LKKLQESLKRGAGGEERVIEGVTMTKTYDMHVWKQHNEISHCIINILRFIFFYICFCTVTHWTSPRLP